MEKKYIIELKDNTAWLQWVNVVDDGQVYFDFKYPEDLTPYTEPDLEQIRKETYEEGYKEGMQLSIDDAKLKEEYKHGLSDAWEAARKIWEYGTTTLREIFGEGIMRMDYFMKFTASEAIEKIRQYEQKKEEQITKGDVVRIKSAPEVEILVTHADGGHVSGIALTELGDSCKIGDQYTDISIHKVEKTGEHYEIAEILQKMKGSES